MKLVVIETPFAAKSRWPIISHWQRWMNLRYTRKCMRDSIARGEAPFASHMLYAQSGVLDDNNFMDRAIGIECGLEWGACAHATVVYEDRGISKGMQMGIDRAMREGRPVRSRRLYNLVAGDL